MTSRAKRQGAPLFAAAGLERAAPRPLADKLRPTRLDEVVGWASGERLQCPHD